MAGRIFTSSRLRMFAWVLFFALMLPGGYHRFYIAPWQLPIINGGALILLTVFVIDLVNALLAGRAQPRPEGTRFTRWMETCAHCLPLFIFASVGVTELTGSPLTGGDSARAAQALARAEEGTAITISAGQDGYQQVSLLQLFTASEIEEGAAIEMTGRLYKTGGEQVGWLDPSYGAAEVDALLYRYLISCCVADAMPLSVVLAGADIAALEQQGWVRVRGRIAPQMSDSQPLTLDVESIEPVDAPKQPYLSLYDTLWGEGGAMQLPGAHGAPPEQAGELPDLQLDPDNPDDDPMKDYDWPTAD